MAAMLPTDLDVGIKKVSFDRISIATEHSLADVLLRQGEMRQFRDEIERLTVFRFVSYLYARTVETWPATWWDAFKDRWFPAWAKRRWPVERTTLKQLVPTLDAPPGHSPLYVAFGGSGDQRLFPHGERPAKMQPYDLKVPVEDIRWCLDQAMVSPGTVFGNTEDEQRLERVGRWLHEYQYLGSE